MTIYALSTGPGVSGIAVIRLSGDETPNVIRAITGKDLPPPRVATLRKINKINTIIFSDVTKFPRYIEALILFLNNPIKLLKPAKYLFCSEYLKYNYYFRSQDKLILRFIKHYNVRILENLNGNKLSRFTILFKIK